MDIDERFRNKIMNDILIRLRTKDYVLSAEENIEAADEIQKLREYIKNWKDTDSAAIIALSQAKEEIERFPRSGMRIIKNRWYTKKRRGVTRLL